MNGMLVVPRVHNYTLFYSMNSWLHFWIFDEFKFDESNVKFVKISLCMVLKQEM